MTTRTLTLTLLRPDLTPVAEAPIVIVLVDERGRTTSDQGVVGSITTLELTGETDANGVAEFELHPNVLGTQATLYKITAKDPVTGEMLLRRPGLDAQLFIMPDADTSLQQTGDPSDLDDDALTWAAVSAFYAELWATHDPDGTVPEPPGDGTLKSARAYAAEAAATVAAAVGDIETARDAALTAISDDRTAAIDAINTAANDGVQAVIDARDQGVGAVNDARDTALTAIAAEVDKAAAWAEGTEPGGEGTKSSREHAEDSGASAELSEKWATGTEPGGEGTLSAREEAERAGAEADSVKTLGSKTIATTAYTLLQADLGLLLIFTAATDVTLTIPTIASDDIADQFFCAIVQGGAGQVILSPAGGAAELITFLDSDRTAGVGAWASLARTGAVYRAGGDLV